MSNDRLPTIEEMSGLLDWTPAKPEPVLTRAEAEARLTDEVVMAVFELLDWDTRAGSCDQARQTVLSALFPEGGK